MRIIVVSLDDIIADPLFNCRYQLNPTEAESKVVLGNKSAQTIEELTKAIIRDGLMSNLVVIPGEGGKYKLVSGFRRFTALNAVRLLGKEGKLPRTSKVENPDVVACNVFEGKPEDAAVLNFNENTQRKDMTTYEMSYACWNLKKNFNMTVEKIASRTMLSPSHVTNLVRAQDALSDRIKDNWREGHGACTTDWLFMIAKESKEIQETEWEKRLAERGTEKGKRRKINGQSKVEGQVETKTRRILPSVIEDARKAVESNRELTNDVKKFYMIAFDFCLGKRGDIPDVYDVEAVAKAHKEATEKSKAEDTMLKVVVKHPEFEATFRQSHPHLVGKLDEMKVKAKAELSKS